MVSTDLQGLVTTHDETDLLRLLVLQQTNITCTTLLPFLRFLVKAEELGPDLELDILVLFVGLDFNLVFKLDHRVELWVMLSFNTLVRISCALLVHTASTGSLVSCSDMIFAEETWILQHLCRDTSRMYHVIYT